MKKLIVLLSLSFTSLSFAQFTNLMISNTNSPEEVSICINPKNTSQVVAGANIDNVYYSNDGGTTWTVGTLTEPVTGVWGDPVVFTDTAGAFYYAHLSYPPTGNWIDRIVVQKSTNGGVSWGSGSWAGLNGTKAQDKEALIVNQANNEIYMSWTQFDNYGSSGALDSSVILFSKSSDGGQTWSNAKRINKIAGDCIDSDNTMEGAIPTVGANGDIYVIWTGPNGIVFNKSTDGGNTWMAQETPVVSTPGGWDYNITGLQRCNGLPQSVVDLSGGPNHGTIYVNWTDQRNGSTDTDVFLVKSTDGGQTWSAPIRVNDDPAGRQQFLTWMTIDQTNGKIYCVFYDRRNYASTSAQTDVYLAVSSDGGNTFANYKINQNPFTPSPAIFFGDYISISAHNNVVRPMWMQYGGGTLSVWTADIDGSVVGNAELQAGLKSSAELLQNFPNPVTQTENTWIKFSLRKPAKVNLQVFDAFGKNVAVLLDNEQYKAGNFDYIFNAQNYGLPAGLYYYTLNTGEASITRKMMVVY